MNEAQNQNDELKGLGGWLLLVGFGIVVSPLRIIGTMYPVYNEIFSSGTWELLTTPGSEFYHPLWSKILYGEMLINTALVAAWIYIAVLFFSKKKTFPKWYIGTVIFGLLFIVADAAAVKLVIPDAPMFDRDTMAALVPAVIAALIWIPYMFVSKRVKATFVE